ncbi:hypothetical protein A3D70_01665 [Candidatus Adlerbacteria bacterium RIFCSPHIGHO2_02_FULL_54_18]|uniref:Uncharacterized protein n=1 Tax=Candidatus Adlerbacteria bacterium RIFCSPHIGHO2_02_FULL_54_18 TaxID=1797241 RepID=A0A1F4Y572_9BACT|nr:MAG: hypothetical protein A3D70_01665 [Candidatus Adlerbacteria bacterium RIFCSPHIGHO2_02_FULL_54_18]
MNQIAKKVLEGEVLPPAKWRIEGYDTFEGGEDAFYPLDGEYDTEAEVRAAAQRQLDRLEKEQPSESSGGQGDLGIQDQVFIVDPEGRRMRFTGGM